MIARCTGRDPKPTPTPSRNLSIALDNVGRVEGDLGNLEAARAAYRESLDIARRLREAFPNHPQFEQDLTRIIAGFGAVEATARGDGQGAGQSP
jgi:hypothetical protein